MISDGLAPVPPSTQPVSISGAAPESWAPTLKLAGVAGGGVVLGALLIAAGIDFGWLIVVIGGLFVPAVLIQWIGQAAVIGKPYFTAGPEGIKTPAFTLPWSDISAYEFVTQGMQYQVIDSAKTKVINRSLTSIIITRRTTDPNGRPIQWGSTLPGFHTGNFDEFGAAVRTFAPHVGVGSTLGAGAYTQDPAVTAHLRALIAQDGFIDISKRRGGRAFQIGPQGIVVGTDSVLWQNVTQLAAVTDVHTTSTNGIKTSERTHRLVVVTNLPDAKTGKTVILRPEYEPSFQPTIEQIAPIIRELAPTVQFTDRRTR